MLCRIDERLLAIVARGAHLPSRFPFTGQHFRCHDTGHAQNDKNQPDQKPGIHFRQVPGETDGFDFVAELLGNSGFPGPQDTQGACDKAGEDRYGLVGPRFKIVLRE